MAKQNIISSVTQPIVGPIDCACVIHGNAYSWTYVENLYNMLSRHITPGIRLHVYTEADRVVPTPMIKHTLIDWNIGGPKKAWWYKMQLFNKEHYSGPMLYFDLDVIIVKNIDWVWQLPSRYFWTVRDFKYLWRPTHYGINSSIMWWDTQQFDYIWQNFANQSLQKIMQQYRGDQDYLTATIVDSNRRFFETERVKSWRWECLDGGFDFHHKRHQQPKTGTQITDLASILIFHGKPKPNDIQDPVIIQHWK
jgi:hypothetical protein